MSLTLANAAPVNSRGVKDANYIATCLLPSGLANTNTNLLDLVQAVPYPVTEKVVLNLATGASTSGNSINMNLVFEHCADNNTSNFVAIPELAQVRLTPNATATAASNTNVLLPPTVKRYVRAKAVGATNMGNLSDATVTIQLLF